MIIIMLRVEDEDSCLSLHRWYTSFRMKEKMTGQVKNFGEVYLPVIKPQNIYSKCMSPIFFLMKLRRDPSRVLNKAQVAPCLPAQARTHELGIWKCLIMRQSRRSLDIECNNPNGSRGNRSKNYWIMLSVGSSNMKHA